MNKFLNGVAVVLWTLSIMSFVAFFFSSWAGFAVFVIFLLAWWLAVKTSPPTEELNKPRKHRSQMLP